MSAQTILVPVEFPDPEPFPSTFVDAFSSCRVVLLGLDEEADGLDEDERHRREIEAYHTLYNLASQFVRHGERVDVEYVVGENAHDTWTRVAEERDVDALLVPKPLTTLARVLVPIRDETFAQPVADFLSGLNQDVLVHTTLFYVAETEDGVEEGEELLASVREQLVDAGYPELRTDVEVVVGDDAPFEVGKAASDYDLIVMGETKDPSFERVFGKTYDSIADETDHPIVVVRED